MRRTPRGAGAALAVLLMCAGVSCNGSTASSPTQARPSDSSVTTLDQEEPDQGEPDQGEAEANNSTTAPSSSAVWPYDSFWTVPQLGVDPARGSGCGLANPVGDVLPDGVWFGQIESLGARSMTFDGQCVYYGTLGQQKHDEYYLEHPDEPDTGPGGDFWVVNASTKVRPLPLSPDLRRRNATTDGCTDPGPAGDLRLADGSAEENDQYRRVQSWIIVSGGQVVFILTGCAFG